MPRLPGVSTASPIRGQIQNIENKFTGGLITEASGLNFPESACTTAQNCVFSLQGTVARRSGIDYEVGYAEKSIAPSTTQAKITYLWQNVEGDGQINFVVAQIGNTLYFYNAVLGQPLSPNYIGSVGLNQFAVSGSADTGNTVCQFAAGNGYLFVAHPYCDPVAITYASGTFTTQQISIQVRDFGGVFEPGVLANTRPVALSPEHQYNIQNQGWTSPDKIWAGVAATGNTLHATIGASENYNIATGLSIANGTVVYINIYGAGTEFFTGGLNVTPAATGIVTGYNSGTGVLTVQYNYVDPPHAGFIFIVNTSGAGAGFTDCTEILIYPVNLGNINAFFSFAGVYPSNADVWWYFKDTSNVFDLTATFANVTLAAGQAPQGYYILSAFNQTRGLASGITGLTDVMTSTRPSTVAWFQGRAWYSGVYASVPASGDATYYSWTQNIYFSQIVTDLNDTSDFGLCYQNEDPTSETLFDLLPTDGGVIRIADCGQIFKLFPIQGAMIVFASNGIWTITGNTGLGFTANDYSVNKLSSIRCIAGTNFVDVLGFPMWWTQEGIYTIRVDVTAGGLRVDSLTDTTIKTFYRAIPLANKQHAVGYYNPLTFTVTYLYRSTGVGVFNDGYVYDSGLAFHTITGAWSPLKFGSNVSVHGIVVNPVGVLTDMSGTPTDYVNSYLVSAQYPVSDKLLLENGSRLLQENSSFILLEDSNEDVFTFAQTRDNVTWKDWTSFDTVGQDVPAFFEAGYRVHGEGAKKFQTNYVFVYSNNTIATQYTLHGFWNYARLTAATTTDYPGLVSATSQAPQTSIQTLSHDGSSSDYAYRRIKLRGNGEAVQFEISSISGKPFHIIGWSIFETTNQGV